MAESMFLKKITPEDAASIEARVYGRARAHQNLYACDYADDAAYADASALRNYWQAVRRRKWLIAGTTLLVTSLVAALVYTSKPKYEATAIVEVGKENTTLIQVAQNLIVQNDDTPKTKSFVIQSTPILEDVVVKLQLDKNPKFLDADSIDSSRAELAPSGPADRLVAEYREPEAARQSDEADRDQAALLRSPGESLRLEPYVAAIEDNLKVEEVMDTRLLKVTFKHTDPAMAAAVSNGVVETLIQRSFEGKTEKFSKASSWLERETVKLKKKMEEAEKALADYTERHGVILPEGAGAVTASKLSNLYSEALRAESDRVLKQSIYEEVKAGRVEQVPEAFTNPRAIEIQKKLADLQTTAAQLDVNYGPESPQVAEVQQQIAAVQRQLSANTRLLEEKLKGDYQRALRDERALKAMLGQAKAEAVHQNQTSTRYEILKAQFDTAKSLYTDFITKTNQANFQAAQQDNSMRVIQPARVPRFPSGPPRSLLVALSFILSLAAGIGLALLVSHFDTTIKSLQDVSHYMQLPALGAIPAIRSRKRRALAAKGEPRPVALSRSSIGGSRKAIDSLALAADAYRVVRTSVLLSVGDKAPKTILVTSSQPNEGKTTTVVNTAISMAQLGASVLIIDCDLRTPSVHEFFGADKDPGLATYLSTDARVEPFIRKLPLANLSLLPAGTTTVNPAELVSSEKMRNLIRTLSMRYDHILIDSPPLINLAEPVVLSSLVDGVILVVSSGRISRDAALRAREELLNVGAEIFGVVLNNVDLRHEGMDYHKHYYSYK